MDLKERLEQFKAEQRQKDLAYKEEQEKREQEWRETKLRVDKEVMPNLRRATAKEYSEWVKGYMEKGGEPTHFYDRAMSSDYYVATRDFTLLPLYGASSINVIVPEGITVSLEDGGRDAGHCDIYYMEDFQSLGFHGRRAMVPIFSDTSV